MDKNLIKILSPHINPAGGLIFENINYLRKEDIPILDVILSDFSVDAYSKSQRVESVIIYSDSVSSGSRWKLNNIKKRIQIYWQNI